MRVIFEGINLGVSMGFFMVLFTVIIPDHKHLEIAGKKIQDLDYQISVLTDLQRNMK